MIDIWKVLQKVILSNFQFYVRAKYFGLGMNLCARIPSIITFQQITTSTNVGIRILSSSSYLILVTQQSNHYS